LPPFKILFVLIALLVLLTWVFWRTLIKLYARAQVAIEETLAQPPDQHHPEHNRPLVPMLRDADLGTFAISADSPAAGRLISELQLRTRTGASIVAIERGGATIINPGPDEELLAGDQILLIGTTGQLAAGKQALLQPQTVSRDLNG